MKTKSDLVVTSAPARVSLMGGGTDFRGFFAKSAGNVVSVTLNQYVYVTLKRRRGTFGEPFRISYSVTENVNHVSAIRNDIVRGCFQLLDFEEPVVVSTFSDIPEGSGLGTSSSFAVALLNAIHNLRGEQVSSEQLAHEATAVELDILRQPIGLQDQFAAAYGGLNLFTFRDQDLCEVRNINVGEWLKTLFSSLLLVWTGVQREASSILSEQSMRIEEKRSDLTILSRQSLELAEHLRNESLSQPQLADMLTESWLLKKGFASGVSDRNVNQLFERCLQAGALGGKLLGAGGGGFLLMVVPTDLRQSFMSHFSETIVIPLEVSEVGSHRLL